MDHSALTSNPNGTDPSMRTLVNAKVSCLVSSILELTAPICDRILKVMRNDILCLKCNNFKTTSHLKLKLALHLN